MHHLCLHSWSILSIVGINTINNIIIIIIFNETLLSSVVVLTVQYYCHDKWYYEYDKEQLYDSFMTRFISNVVTYTATQAQHSNDAIHGEFKFGLYMIRNMPIVSNTYYSGVMCLWQGLFSLYYQINVQENWVQWIYGFVHCVK